MIKIKDTMSRDALTEVDAEVYLVLDVSEVGLTDDQFFRLCRDNGDFHIEMSGGGELIIMSPNRPKTGRKHSVIIQRLRNWAERDGTGDVYDATSEFALPNGAKRAPDASWILNSRWNADRRATRSLYSSHLSGFCHRSPISHRQNQTTKGQDERVCRQRSTTGLASRSD